MIATRIVGRCRPVAVGLGLVLLLSACGNDPTPKTAPEAEGNTSSEAFPVTIEHKYGSTTISEEPGRVVTVGLTDQDAVIALGVTPVGVTNWYGEYPNGTWPWAQDELGDATLEVMPRNNDEFNFERIAAMQPDLILALYTGMSESDYELMSQIAPTVAQSGDYEDWSMPWQEMTLVTGRALGREDRAEELITEIEGLYAQAHADHPEFEDSTAIFVERDVGASSFYPRGVLEPRVRVLTDLGFTVPEKIADLAGDYGTEISDERMELLDADVVVWAFYEPGVEDELKSNPIYQQLPVAQEGRDIFLQDEVLSGALVWSSVLSLPYAIEHLVPKLAAAIDGDPNTEEE